MAQRILNNGESGLSFRSKINSMFSELYGFMFTQNTPSSTWTVPHNLGYMPHVSAYTTGGVEFMVDVEHQSPNVAILKLSTPMSGFARFS